MSSLQSQTLRFPQLPVRSPGEEWLRETPPREPEPVSKRHRLDKKNKFNPVYPVTIMHSESSAPSSLPSSVPSKPSWTVLSESASPLHQDDLSALDPLMVPRSPSHPCRLCQLQCPCFHSHHRLSPSHQS